MNLLELFVRVHSESGRQGTIPTTVTNQTGEMLRLLNWVKTSYEDIQLKHETWLFRRDLFSGSTVATQQAYTPAQLGISDFSSWWYDSRPEELSGIRVYSSEADENHLEFVPWHDFSSEYMYGSRRSQTERPTVFSIHPNDSIYLWPIPNSILTINGHYVKQPAVMSDASDVPIFNDFHMTIMWKALMYYGAKAGRNDVYVHGKNQYDDLMFKMEKRYLPEIHWGQPLA